MKSRVEDLFPVRVYNFMFDNYKELNEELTKEVYNIKDKENNVEKSNKGGFHSSIDLDLRSTDCFNELKNRILDIMNQIIIKNDFPHIKERHEELDQLHAMWFIINNKEDFNSKHIHPGSWFSGAYYVKVPDNEAKFLIFEDPIDIRTFEQDSPPSYIKEVSEGMLVIFPGWFTHSVPPGDTDEDRIVISFNIPKPSLLFSRKELLNQ